NPGVVEPSYGREWRARAAALQNDRKCGQRLCEAGGPEQALIPGISGIEVVDQILRENVGVTRREGVERLGRNRIEAGADRIGVCRLQARVGLKAKPGDIARIDVVINSNGLHL